MEQRKYKLSLSGSIRDAGSIVLSFLHLFHPHPLSSALQTKPSRGCLESDLAADLISLSPDDDDAN